MTTFPSIQPSSRVWSPGQRAQSLYQTLDGIEIRFIHGSRITGHRLSLSFENVTEVVGKSITAHYVDNGTTYGTFDLPAAIFAGMATYDYINEATNAWRYLAPPVVTYNQPGYQSVTVELLGVAA